MLVGLRLASDTIKQAAQRIAETTWDRLLVLRACNAGSWLYILPMDNLYGTCYQ